MIINCKNFRHILLAVFLLILLILESPPFSKGDLGGLKDSNKKIPSNEGIFIHLIITEPNHPN
mgnify:CR=1 FL=1|jgi:hypothetical protein